MPRSDEVCPGHQEIFLFRAHHRVLHVSPSNPALGRSSRYFQINNSRGIMSLPAQLSGGGDRNPGAGAPLLPLGFAALLTDSPSYSPCCEGERCLLSVPVPTLSLLLAWVFSAFVTQKSCKAAERGAAFCCGTPLLAISPSHVVQGNIVPLFLGQRGKQFSQEMQRACLGSTFSPSSLQDPCSSWEEQKVCCAAQPALTEPHLCCACSSVTSTGQIIGHSWGFY